MGRLNLRKPEPSTIIYGTLLLLAAVLVCLWLSMLFLHLRISRAMRIDLDRSVAASSATAGSKNQAGPAVVPKEFQDMVKGRGIFGKVPDAQLQLQAVVADSVLIDGQWIKAGEKQGNIKVLEIGSAKAVIEFKGQRRELQIWPNLPGT